MRIKAAVILLIAVGGLTTRCGPKCDTKAEKYIVANDTELTVKVKITENKSQYVILPGEEKVIKQLSIQKCSGEESAHYFGAPEFDLYIDDVMISGDFHKPEFWKWNIIDEDSTEFTFTIDEKFLSKYTTWGQ